MPKPKRKVNPKTPKPGRANAGDLATKWENAIYRSVQLLFNRVDKLERKDKRVIHGFTSADHEIDLTEMEDIEQTEIT